METFNLINLAIMNPYNDLIMPDSSGSPIQQDYQKYSGDNSFELPYSPARFMPPLSSSTEQQPIQSPHMNLIQQQRIPFSQSLSRSQAAIHQVY